MTAEEGIRELEELLLNCIHGYAQADLRGDISEADALWYAVQAKMEALIQAVQEAVLSPPSPLPTSVQETPVQTQDQLEVQELLPQPGLNASQVNGNNLSRENDNVP